ncbi:MAG: NUDIX hydrolase [Archangium sp.]|nr:NUDIX hydrolase [Archangium sp.]
MRIPAAAWGLVKEVARHLLRRPVVGLVAIARTTDGQVVLIRRGDTGEWAPPGGTLEWGETFRSALPRELLEEAGVDVLEVGEVLGVYSDPRRDTRFHAVTVVVAATVSAPHRPPMNSLEIRDVGLFAPDALPSPLAHGMSDVVARALSGTRHWE